MKNIKGIYEESKNIEEQYFLRLVEDDEDILLVVVDEIGDIVSRGVLLTFKVGGVVIKHCRIDPEFGFDLNKEGELNIIPRS